MMQESVLGFLSKEVNASHLLGHSAWWELEVKGLYVCTHWGEFQHTLSECWACKLLGVCVQTWVCVDTMDGLLRGECQYGAYSGSLQDSLSRGNILCHISLVQQHQQPRKIAFPWTRNVAVSWCCWRCQLRWNYHNLWVWGADSGPFLQAQVKKYWLVCNLGRRRQVRPLWRMQRQIVKLRKG
jgi:hypothetical protein